MHVKNSVHTAADIQSISNSAHMFSSVGMRPGTRLSDGLLIIPLYNYLLTSRGQTLAT